MKNIIFLISICLYIKSLQKKPNVYVVKTVPFGFNALTTPLGIFVEKKHEENKALIEHEKIHWEQFRKYNIFFPIVYAYGAVKYGYDLNPLEIEARKNECDFCKKNYTFCVRNGLADTIQDQNFRR